MYVCLMKEEGIERFQQKVDFVVSYDGLLSQGALFCWKEPEGQSIFCRHFLKNRNNITNSADCATFRKVSYILFISVVIRKKETGFVVFSCKCNAITFLNVLNSYLHFDYSVGNRYTFILSFVFKVKKRILSKYMKFLRP